MAVSSRRSTYRPSLPARSWTPDLRQRRKPCMDEQKSFSSSGAFLEETVFQASRCRPESVCPAALQSKVTAPHGVLLGRGDRTRFRRRPFDGGPICRRTNEDERAHESPEFPPNDHCHKLVQVRSSLADKPGLCRGHATPGCVTALCRGGTRAFAAAHRSRPTPDMETLGPSGSDARRLPAIRVSAIVSMQPAAGKHHPQHTNNKGRCCAPQAIRNPMYCMY